MGLYPKMFWKKMWLTIMWSVIAVVIVATSAVFIGSQGPFDTPATNDVFGILLFMILVMAVPVIVIWLIFASIIGLVLQGILVNERVLGVMTSAMSGAIGFFSANRLIVNLDDAFAGTSTAVEMQDFLILTGSSVAIAAIAFFVWRPQRRSVSEGHP